MSFLTTDVLDTDEESCYGSSMVDEIVTIIIAFFLMAVTVFIAISAKKNLREIKKQNKTLKYLLWFVA